MTDDDVGMTTQTTDRTGVMIVRIWIDQDAEVGLRARITRTLDSTGAEQDVTIAAHVDDVCEVVRRWVDEFSNSN